MYDLLEYTLQQEVKRETKLLKEHLLFLDSAPPGHLNARHRPEGIRYSNRYRSKENGKVADQNISLNDKPELLKLLTQKSISEEIVKRCEGNIEKIKKFQQKYQSIDIRDIAASLDPRFHPLIDDQHYYMVQEFLNSSYIKNPDPFGNNTKLTVKGDLVASKSEVVIADKLFHYNIPYHHDEAFPIPMASGIYIYPDFTILLPNGEKLWWEHFGKLHEAQYAERTVKKLFHYHQCGAVIGRNLFISIDDSNGNCDSPAIERMIKDYILPHFTLA